MKLQTDFLFFKNLKKKKTSYKTNVLLYMTWYIKTLLFNEQNTDVIITDVTLRLLVTCFCSLWRKSYFNICSNHRHTNICSTSCLSCFLKLKCLLSLTFPSLSLFHDQWCHLHRPVEYKHMCQSSLSNPGCLQILDNMIKATKSQLSHHSKLYKIRKKQTNPPRYRWNETCVNIYFLVC